VAPALLVSISLFVSLAWSIARRDPQIGFTIGGSISAAGSIAIAVAKTQEEQQEGRFRVETEIEPAFPC
jgi:hypothetical protein